MGFGSVNGEGFGSPPIVPGMEPDYVFADEWDGPKFVTVKDVELVSAGMQWPSAGGPVTITLEHLADAALAGEDTLITPPRLKIGHSDPRFQDTADDHDPYFDGEAAFGTITNMHLVNDGAVLVGDYTNVPAWLAAVLPSAYPSRSIEGAYEIGEGSGGKLEARWDVETPAGRHYSFVLTACALLGLAAPAVKDIEDLQFRLTEGGGVIVTGNPEAGGVPIAVSMGAVPGAVSLEADVDRVIDVFYAEFCVDERYWWWARAVRVDPNVIIADDDEGSLWRVPINTDADQNVTFGEPERVLQTFEPAPEAAASLAAAAQTLPRGSRTLKAFAAREQTVPAERRERPEGGVSGSGNTSGMDFSELSATARKRLCAAYDLSEDATDEQIATALEAEPDTPPADPPADPEETPETPETPEEETPEEDKPEETPAEEPTVPVDKTALAELQANAELGRQAREQQVAQHRETVLKAALEAGKITPASKSAWETKLKAAPEATEAELSSLPTGLVPVEEIGHGGSSPSDPVAVSADEMAAMFPGHRKAAA